MNIVIINRSDSLGGAAVVSFRLMKALRAAGHDATMLVLHKGTDSPYVHVAGPPWRVKEAFLAERLRIFTANGFNRADLFKVSIATDGLPLSRHPLVQRADAVLLGWVNQGMLSLREVARIAAAHTTLWTMHDMWNITGICHIAGLCRGYTHVPGCGNCPMLHFMAFARDISRRTWGRKVEAYSRGRIRFVAVSSWLKNLAAEAPLMHGQSVTVIHNAFPTADFYTEPRKSRTELGLPDDKRKIILMGAARLDDPVKGLDYAVDILNRLHRTDAVAVFFGALRNPEALAGLRFPYVLLGPVADPAVVRELYAHATAVISTARYESLGGTLVEGQAAGATPLAFDTGGRCDIIRSSEDGFLIPPYDCTAFAEALNTALDTPLPRHTLAQTVADRFSEEAVARKYIELIKSAR